MRRSVVVQTNLKKNVFCDVHFAISTIPVQMIKVSLVSLYQATRLVCSLPAVLYCPIPVRLLRDDGARVSPLRARVALHVSGPDGVKRNDLYLVGNSGRFFRLLQTFVITLILPTKSPSSL